MSKKLTLILALTALLVGLGAGILVTNLSETKQASAQENEACTVTQERLGKIYRVAFHRGLDKNADFHLGKKLEQVLEDIKNSEEQEKYSALYQATKALEETQREPGEVSSSTLETYRNYIDQAASIINEWAKTLPEQDASEKVIGRKQAREAIQNSYQNLEQNAKENAQKGLIQSKKQIGSPEEVFIPSENLKQARNAQRKSNIMAINNAVHQNKIDNDGSWSGPKIPKSATLISSTNFDICEDVVPTYLAEMPSDPTEGYYNSCDDYNSGYTIKASSPGVITVSAPHAELNQTISTSQ
jgi:hypothetical protein